MTFCEGDCSIQNVFIDFLRGKLFGKKAIVLLEFLFDLPLLRNFVTVLFNPFCDFDTPADSLVGNHLNL